MMRNKIIKKKTLEEYYRIKVDIECVFLTLLNSKTKIHIPNTHSQSHHLQNLQIHNVQH